MSLLSKIKSLLRIGGKEDNKLDIQLNHFFLNKSIDVYGPNISFLIGYLESTLFAKSSEDYRKLTSNYSVYFNLNRTNIKSYFRNSLDRNFYIRKIEEIQQLIRDLKKKNQICEQWEERHVKIAISRGEEFLYEIFK